MELTLLDLRRYAIDNRVEIRFADPDSGHECSISTNGQVKIPGERKDFRAEDVLAAAQSFELAGTTRSQRLTRDQMAKVLGEALATRGSAAPTKDEE